MTVPLFGTYGGGTYGGGGAVVTGPNQRLDEALRIIGGESQDDWVDDIAYQGGVSSLHSHALRQARAGADLYVDAWLLLLEREHHNRERVIETYDPSIGYIEWPSFPFQGSQPQIAVGEHFQVWTRFRPTDVERALLLCLKNMHQVRIDYLTGATINGLRQINLTSALPHLTNVNQVVALSTFDGTAPGAEEAFAGGLFVNQSGGVDAAVHASLGMQAVQPYGTGDTLVVYSLASWADSTSNWQNAPHGFPQDLSTGNSQVSAELWAFEALYRLSRQTQYRDQDLETHAIMRLNELRPQFAPEVGYRAFMPRAPWGVDGRNGW